jgi:hypothetical protein
MKLVPFIHRQKQVNSFWVSELQLFLSHAGRSVWKTEEPGSLPSKTILEEYCEPNGFFIKNVHMDTQQNIAYVEIDPEKTKLCDFYTWEEALQQSTKPECWRTFFFMKDKNNEHWYGAKGIVEAEIQDLGNIADVYERIQSFLPTV